MLDNTPPESDHRAWARRRIFLHAVLRYLIVRGPTNWLTLYMHFDQHGTGEIGSALAHLAFYKHIEVEGTTVKITASGQEQLPGH